MSVSVTDAAGEVPRLMVGGEVPARASGADVTPPPVPASHPPAIAAVAAPPSGVEPLRAASWSDRFAFLFAVLLQAATGTVEALGFGHPLRLPAAIVVWLITFCFLGLPTVHLAHASWGEVIRYGNWGGAAWLAAMLEVGGVFLFQVLRSGNMVSKAMKHVPQMGVQALISRGDALYQSEVRTNDELKAWMERVRAWTELCERELTESVSAQAADAFRRPSVIQVYKHRQRFNDVHNGWLDLLAKRLDALRSLSGRLRPGKRRFSEEPGPQG